ncbi:MAG: molecular chaperone DnaJ [Methanobacteriaceae archaeon]
MSKRDYYEVLGVEKGDDPKTIKKAYKKLAIKYHPDVSEDEGAADKFKEISEAYAVLSDDEKRQKYDQFGHAGMDGFSNEDIFRNINFEDIFGGRGGGAGFDVNNIFDMFGFGGGGGFGRQNHGPERGRDVFFDLEITLEEAASGIEKDIDIRHYKTCDTCNGSKAEPGSETPTCQTCGGTGQVKRVQNTFLGQMVSVDVCRDCNGEGKIIKESCHECKGKGKVRERKTIHVKIPAGVDSGSRLRVGGEGNAGDVGAPYGDLIITVHVKHNKNFEREGNNLYFEKAISFVQATLGATVEVPTIDGAVDLKIPAGTQSGTVFRLRDQGMPFLNRPGKGNLYVTVNVVIPRKISDEQKKILKDFADISGEEIHTFEKGFFDKVKDAINH